MNRYAQLVSQVLFIIVLGIAAAATVTALDPIAKVAVNDGTMKITPSDVKNGVPLKNGNFFLNCSTLDTLGTNVFYEVAIGDYIDYLIPMKGATACDVLSGETVYIPSIGRSVNKYYYSSISPLSSDFEGALTTVIPSTSNIGGSVRMKLKERHTLNVWGTMFSSGNPGGCCKLSSSQSLTWHLPYTITAYNFDATKTYFQLPGAPSTVFVGETFHVIIQQGDIYGNTSSSACTLKMQVNDETPMVFKGSSCFATFNYTIKAASATATTIKIYVGDTLKRQLSVNTVALPTGFQALSINKKVNKALGWNLDKDKGKFPSFVNLNPSMWFSLYYTYFPIDDYELKPFSGMKDLIKVPESWSEISSNESGTWIPTTADTEGRFGSGVTNTSTIQYFAFVLYAIERQSVKFNIKCVNLCIVYIGGSAYANNTLYNVEHGYQQVIVKVQTRSTTGPTTGFTFEMSHGYGIAVGLDVPFISPPGTDVLAPGEFVTEFLTVKKPFEGPFETDYLSKNDSDASVKPIESDPLFIRVANSEGNFSVRGNGAAGKSAVNYFSAGLLASNDGMITISLPVVGGMTTIWLDGNVVYKADAAIQDGDEFGFLVTEGWHQLLIKVYVAEGADDWMFKMEGLESDDTVVFTALQMPISLPKYAFDIFNKPINQMISPMSGGENMIPFNFNNTSERAFSDPTFSLIDVTQKQRENSVLEIDGVVWKWAMQFGSNDTGEFNMYSGSGAANRYYAFALYFTEPVAQLNLSVMHYSGMGMWMDGKQVLAKKDKSDGDIVTINNVEKGWRQFHLRLQTPKDMDLVPIEMKDDPNHMCGKNGFNLCFDKNNICPNDVPKLGYPLPMKDVSYAAFSNFVVGLSGNDLCKNISKSNISSVGKQYAACCGTSKTTTKMSIGVNAYTGNSGIGWAPFIRLPPLKKPTFVTQNEDGYTLVTIKAINGAEIFFRINEGSGNIYLQPINVTAAARIRAFILFEGLTSPTNEIIVSDLHRYKVSRTECPANVSCAIKLSDDIHQVTGSYVVLVDSSLPGTLINVLSSSKYARAGGNDFTKLLRVLKSGIFVTPGIEVLQSTTSKSKTMKMIVFPPGADRDDVPGILVDGLVVVTLLDVAPAKEGETSVKKLNAALLKVSGGLVTGDFVSFPQLHSNTSDCDSDACFQLMQNATNRQIIGPKGAAVPVDLLTFSGDELKCICVVALGGSDITESDKVITKNNTVAIPISVKVTQADADSTKQELLSFSPSVVSKGDTMHISGYFADSATVTFRCALDIVKRCSSTVPTFTRINSWRVSLKLESGVSLPVAKGDGKTAKRYKLQNWDGIIGAPSGKSPFGVWRAVVNSDDRRKLKVQGTYQPSVAYIPAPPNVTFMGGPCANWSVNCINGTVIDIIGSGFNTESLKHNEVILMDGAERSKTVSCIPYKVNETVLSCLLEIKPDDRPKRLLTLDVNVATLVAASDDVYGASLPKSVYKTGNSLILNGGERRGWTGQFAPTLVPTPEPSPGNTLTTLSNSSSGKTVSIVIGVIFAIVGVVVLVGGIFVYKKYRFKKNDLIGGIEDSFVNNSTQDSVSLNPMQQSCCSPVQNPRSEDFVSDMSPILSPRSDGQSPCQSPRSADL